MKTPPAPIARFKDRSGHIYGRNLLTGTITRLSPLRPWHGKSERRRVIKARREG
jgi:hypothetical protein